MANTNAVYARIDTSLKADAEQILGRLGISPSSAIQMFYSQVVLQQGLPFEPRLPMRKPVALGDLSREELDAEVQRGMDGIAAGRTHTAAEVDKYFADKYGVTGSGEVAK